MLCFCVQVINALQVNSAPLSVLFWVATKRSRPVQQTGDVMPSNAEVCRDVHALVAEVVCHRQAFDAP